MAKGNNKRHWTEDQDAAILSMKARGDTWDQVAAALGLPVDSVSDRGYRIGVPKSGGGRRPPPGNPADDRAEATAPLEAGHAFTWNPLWPSPEEVPDFKSAR